MDSIPWNFIPQKEQLFLIYSSGESFYANIALIPGCVENISESEKSDLNSACRYVPGV